MTLTAAERAAARAKQKETGTTQPTVYLSKSDPTGTSGKNITQPTSSSSSSSSSSKSSSTVGARTPSKEESDRIIADFKARGLIPSDDLHVSAPKTPAPAPEPPKDERSTLRKIGDFLGIFTGGEMRNPITGEAYIDPSTGEPAQVLQGTLPLTPTGGAISVGNLIGKTASGALGKIPSSAQLGKVTTNTKTIAQTNSFFKRILTSTREVKSTNPKTGIVTTRIVETTDPIKVATVVGGITAIIGTYPWAEWAQGEAIESINFASAKALATGDPEIIRQFQEETNAVLDRNFWEKIARVLPGTNLITGFLNKWNALEAQWKVNNKLLNDALIQQATGESENDKWARVRQEEVESEKLVIDYYNEQRKLIVEWELEAKAAAQIAQSREYASGQEDTRAAEIKARNEDAAFWAAQAAKQRELEAEDRIAVAEFWIAYRKAAQKAQDEQRPSNLNFGLL